jgi:hypothetical protein
MVSAHLRFGWIVRVRYLARLERSMPMRLSWIRVAGPGYLRACMHLKQGRIARSYPLFVHFFLEQGLTENRQIFQRDPVLISPYRAIPVVCACQVCPPSRKWG